jgi:hypothetical protein
VPKNEKTEIRELVGKNFAIGLFAMESIDTSCQFPVQGVKILPVLP